MATTWIMVGCALLAGLLAGAAGMRLAPRPRGGVLLLFALIALGVAAALFGKFGGFFGGSGSPGEGDGEAPATRPQRPPPDTQPPPVTRPLEITVREKGYVVQGRQVSLEQIEAMLDKIPDGSGPDVQVFLADDSRPPREIALRKLLKKHSVTSLWPQAAPD